VCEGWLHVMWGHAYVLWLCVCVHAYTHAVLTQSPIREDLILFPGSPHPGRVREPLDLNIHLLNENSNAHIQLLFESLPDSTRQHLAEPRHRAAGAQ
jgi:hypothetical protein